MQAVSEATMFGEFAPCRVALHRKRTIAEPVMLEAQFFGVGLTDTHGKVVFPAEPPAAPTRDGWAWLLEEKTYRAWLG